MPKITPGAFRSFSIISPHIAPCGSVISGTTASIIPVTHTYALSYMDIMSVLDSTQASTAAMLSAKYTNGVRIGGRMLGASEIDGLDKYSGAISALVNTGKITYDSTSLAVSSNKSDFTDSANAVTKDVVMAGAGVVIGEGVIQGAVIGAAVGSIFPGPGTVVGAAVGAVVGGVIGVATGFELDKLYDEQAAPTVKKVFGKYYDWIPAI